MEAVRDTFIVFAMLLALAVHSWGACTTISISTISNGILCHDGMNCTGGGTNINYPCPSVQASGNYYFVINEPENPAEKSCYPYNQARQWCPSSSNMSAKLVGCRSTIRCSTQAEADSVACANDPTLPNCAVVSDTLLFACSESMVNGQAVATIYRLSCKASNGEITECNGKQNIDIPTDGQPIKQMSGTCAQNGLNVGPFGGASPQDSTSLPNGANAECFAITGSTCHMRDKVSGNTFTCGCDGNCNVAIQNLMAGNADCTNPYPQPSSSADSLQLPQSSASSGGSSASSSGSTGSSGSGEGSSGSGDDFEYDYSEVLEAIRANTQFTGNGVQDLGNKADKANEYLQQIANKDFSPNINVAAPNVNVTLNADTARAGAAIYGLLSDKLNGGEPNAADTAGTGAQLSGLLGSIDSIVGEGVPDMSDSLGRGVAAMHSAYNGLKDSLSNSAWSDSVGKWQNALTNNGVISGAGADACPAVLMRTWDVPLGVTTASIGPLGKYLCTPFAGSLTGWALARVLLRALVSIFCMIWLFKAVMGIDGGNNEED